MTSVYDTVKYMGRVRACAHEHTSLFFPSYSALQLTGNESHGVYDCRGRLDTRREYFVAVSLRAHVLSTSCGSTALVLYCLIHGHTIHCLKQIIGSTLFAHVDDFPRLSKTEGDCLRCTQRTRSPTCMYTNSMNLHVYMSCFCQKSSRSAAGCSCSHDSCRA